MGCWELSFSSKTEGPPLLITGLNLQIITLSPLLDIWRKKKEDFPSPSLLSGLPVIIRTDINEVWACPHLNYILPGLGEVKLQCLLVQ